MPSPLEQFEAREAAGEREELDQGAFPADLMPARLRSPSVGPELERLVRTHVGNFLANANSSEAASIAGPISDSFSSIGNPDDSEDLLSSELLSTPSFALGPGPASGSEAPSFPAVGAASLAPVNLSVAVGPAPAVVLPPAAVPLLVVAPLPVPVPVPALAPAPVVVPTLLPVVMAGAHLPRTLGTGKWAKEVNIPLGAAVVTRPSRNGSAFYSIITNQNGPLSLPGQSCTAGNCNCGHVPWTTSGVLALPSCAVMCEVCGQLCQNWRLSIGNLRRHVQRAHVIQPGGVRNVNTGRLYSGVQ